MPLRQYRVVFRDGTSEMVQADSLDQAWSKARRSAKRQISTRQMGRKVVESVTPGAVNTEQGVRGFRATKKYRVTFKDGAVVTVDASSEAAARIAAHDKHASTQWGVPTALPIEKVSRA